MDEQTLIGVVERIIDEAKKQGADASEASVSADSGLSVNVRLGEVETVEYHQDRGISVTVYFGHAKGSASTADIKDSAVVETVKAACDIARHTAEDPYSGLPPKDMLAWSYPDLDLHHPWGLDAAAAIKLAIECEDAARGYDPRIDNSEGAQINSHDGLVIRANSMGFSGHYRASSQSVGCSVIARKNGEMQRDGWYSAARDAADLPSMAEVGIEAGKRAVAKLGARKISTCKVPVIFDADISGGLIRHFLDAIRGGSLYRKTSFLLDSLGQTLFPTWLQMRERPHIPKGVGSAPFDREGVITAEQDIVNDGVLQAYLLDHYAANRLGMRTNGHAGGVRNLFIRHSDCGRKSLIEGLSQGLLVTELMGQGVNRVTGDYSRGASGFWIENGAIAYPVEEITVAGNLKDMFLGFQKIADDEDPRRNIRVGSILVDSMTVAGN